MCGFFYRATKDSSGEPNSRLWLVFEKGTTWIFFNFKHCNCVVAENIHTPTEGCCKFQGGEARGGGRGSEAKICEGRGAQV